MVHGRASLPRKPGVAAQHSPFGDGDGVRQGRVALRSIVIKQIMSNLQPVITNKKGTRNFVCSAVALQGVVVNAEGQILLLSSPTRNPDGAWQVVSGALEAGETVLEGTLREVREELGEIQVRPLRTIHAQTFHYDENVQYMIAIYYLLAYEGGEVVPGDDMQGSQYPGGVWQNWRMNRYLWSSHPVKNGY
jgi:ADP-ribose pyrophosphatase YjhB (NUDIX family)